MRIKDYEEAIGALNCDLTIDEFKLRNNQVRRCYAHRKRQLIMWDEMGRGFSVMLHTVEDGDVTSETHEGVTESCYERDTFYDLRF